MVTLKKEILEKLSKRTGKHENTIRKEISLLRRKHARLPINSVAHLYAMQYGISVLSKLDPEDKAALPSFEVEKPIKLVGKQMSEIRKTPIIEFIHYESSNSFVQAHILETNKTYTHGCYTAAFILCRKIIENLIIDVVRKKYPSNTRDNLDIYFDTSKNRTRNFSEIIGNLRKKTNDFGPEKTLLERILTKADIFKDDANDKVHSWYHIVRNRKELDDMHVQDILDMIRELETKI
jgi:hypothetical protein